MRYIRCAYLKFQEYFEAFETNILLIVAFFAIVMAYYIPVLTFNLAPL